MSDQEWYAYLDTLTPEHRTIAQKTMERLTTLLEHDRSLVLDQLQQVQRSLNALRDQSREVGGGE